MLRTNSLSFRLIAGAAVWSVLMLAGGGFALSGIFRSAEEASFDSRLSFYLEDLVAGAETETDMSGFVQLRGRFSDPRFERPFSGWYWQIQPAGAGAPASAPQRSRSLWDHRIVPQDIASGGNVAWGYAAGPDNQRLRVLLRHISLPVANAPTPNTTRAFRFMVAGSISELEETVALFNRTLIWSLAVLGLGLIGAIMIQVRIGLLPLRRVSEALARIREGRARQLEGQFPAEIAPLAAELNGLIAHSAEVVGRARTHVANLAHFLKTPLTVLANEASAGSGALAETVTRQVQAMRRQVDHYLARARAAGARDVLGSRAEVAPVLNDLVRVISRMHVDKKLDIALDIASDPSGPIAFRGEREDLEEMAGNLIDNACKWARAKIEVRVREIDGARFSISVSDDGPGLAPEERERAIERGGRLDELVPGSGLGLAIVRDIAKLYGGNFLLDAAQLGGLHAILDLPRAPGRAESGSIPAV